MDAGDNGDLGVGAADGGQLLDLIGGQLDLFARSSGHGWLLAILQQVKKRMCNNS